jgi:hypothetical protein
MPLITLTDARDLDRWATSRRAQEQLPALIRRLIHATTTTAKHIGLPAGDAVQQGGYDGVVIVNETHYIVPEGVSVWELGVSANPKKKATEDYEKRTGSQPVSDVGPINPATTTFVFVTPRRWNAKSEWAEERRAEQHWRDVRVLDADDLEAWLEQAPATHVWLSTQLGRRPLGADDLEAVWRDWAEATTPPLSPALMFAGRENSRDEIAAWFTSAAAAATFGVESESPEETIALVAAAIQLLPETERIAVLSRTVVVRDTDALVQIAAVGEPLCIVTMFSPGDVAHRATRNGHRVLIPRRLGEGVAETLEVPRLHRGSAERELETMGLTAARARELAGIARRSLMALRRQLATSAAVSRPTWAAPDVGPSLVPMLLVGTVNESLPGDAEALALLARESTEAVFTRLSQFAAVTDPAVRRVGSVWYLVSKADAWEALRRYVTRDALERFETVAFGVIASSDPSYKHPPGQRWAAGLYQKDRAYSGLLVRAVADTLALLGARGRTLPVAPGVSAADYAIRLVRRLFEEAGRDWRRWASLAPVLTSLAEAAPDAFLAAIEAGLQGEEPSPVVGLFGHDVNSFSSSPHTEVLWALERLAWSPEYLGRVALILAELARRDPGGRLTNRPAASLRTIFCPWSPQTAASGETRLTIIDRLRQREPDVAWALITRLLPQPHDTNMVTGKPRWREWAADTHDTITYPALEDHANAMVSRLLDDTGTSGDRWKALIEALDDVPAEAHKRILARLAALAAEPLLPPTARATIWGALRELLSRHRSFPDANWSLPPKRLDAIAEVFAQFEPEDPVARYGFLFSHRSMWPEGRERDFEQRQRVLEARRVDAARALYEGLTIERIVELSASLERSDALGDALAQSEAVPPEAEPRLVLHALRHHEIQARVFGRAYLARIQVRHGEEAIAAFLRHHSGDWPTRVQAEALIAMRARPDTWRLVDALDEEGKLHYWQNVPVFWVESDAVDEAMRELVRYQRPHAALDLAALHLREEPTPTVQVIAHALREGARVAHDVTGARSESYHISELMTFLEQAASAGEINEDDVASLEFLYLPLLRHDRSPELLHRKMGEDPSLFIEAVCLAFRGEGEPVQELDDAGRARAHLAYELLESWRMPPGLDEGVIDGAHLTRWVTEARGRLSNVKRAAIGDQLIGQLLSGSPPGSDGAWPAEPIRDLLEELRSDDLESGLHMGRFNQRGAVWRNLESGGDAERSIKERYEADAAKVSARWPRTAAFLRSFASTYERDAGREDTEAELRQDLEE